MRKAIIIIPGMDSREVGYSTKKLVTKISATSNNTITHTHNEEYSTIQMEGTSAQCIDLFEVYYNDITEKNNPVGDSIYKRVLFGIELIVFWFFSPIWKALKSNKYFLTGIILAGILLVGWYISVVGLMISTMMDQIPSLFSWLGIKPDISETNFFITLSIILGALPIDILLRVSGFSMRYIKTPSLQNQIKKRIHNKVRKTIETDNYDCILIYAHSLGSIFALDYLADFQYEGRTIVKCMTTGAPITFFANKWDQIKPNMVKCSKNKAIQKWTDFYSHEDWMCSYEKADALGKNFSSIELKMNSSWVERFGSKVHLQYTDTESVINALTNI